MSLLYCGIDMFIYLKTSYKLSKTMYKLLHLLKKISFLAFVLLISCNGEKPNGEKPKDEKQELTTEQKADKLHEEILTLDSHVDTPLMFSRDEFDIGEYNEIGKLDFPRMKEGGLDAAFFAVFIGQGPRTPEGYATAKRRAFDIVDQIHKVVEENSDVAGLALTSDDAYRLKKEGKRAIYIGLENGYPIGYDLSILQRFYDKGARYLGLVHSHNNHMSDSSSDRTGEEHGGLSEFGKEVIKELNRLGMMVDVSHMSDKATYDAIKVSKAPVVASHSNVKALCDIHRNLDDGLIKAIAENGGVVQLCLLTVYVKETAPNPQRDSAIAVLRERYPTRENLSDEDLRNVRNEWAMINEKFPRELATVSDLIDHVDYIRDLVGIDYIGIGSDFDGGGALEDCFDVSEMKNITIELLRRGYSNEEIEKIWSGNFMRVFREVERIAQKLN